MNKKARVFWHEFGHFTAAYYNKLFFGKYGTESITINRQEYNGGVDFKGYHTPIKPPDYKIGDPIRHPASLIASLVYGCYLQCIFQGNSLQTCFDEERYGAHGFDDYKKVWGVADQFRLSSEERKALFLCIHDQFQAIRANPEFDDLFKFEITSLIEKDENVIVINPEELASLFKDFLNEHTSAYVEFVKKLENIFENHEYRPSIRN